MEKIERDIEWLKVEIKRFTVSLYNTNTNTNTNTNANAKTNTNTNTSTNTNTKTKTNTIINTNNISGNKETYS